MVTEADPRPTRVLVLFAHPALEKSRVNRRLVAALADLDDVTVNDLYERYPGFDIDVGREQELLASHDVVVLQHPLYWYSMPAILREWQDLVLEHGWAYGHEGGALRGKTLLCAVTTGGNEETYCEQGQNHFTVRQLLAPVEQTASMCRMRFLPPFVVHGTHLMTDAEIGRHAADYRYVITALRDGRLDLDEVATHNRCNARLDRLARA